jgi:hypothetical protein
MDKDLEEGTEEVESTILLSRPEDLEDNHCDAEIDVDKMANCKS